ncbi:hypothetical protein C0Q70_13413 [Pomacea canaliculata]|uniref:Ribonuclease P protein subunit p20 n=1 Tax=Pomacea canaliculata TaxID=400727 RepID=A0A2T7NX54_POMCA|nr:hypothetical protein C0Q70_13413 [Pomacea canaliculata]
MDSKELKTAKDDKKSREYFKDLIDREEYLLKKRLPPRLPTRKNDVYVSRKTNFEAQLNRCQKILDVGNEVYIHGLGSAINRAINLALQLKERGVGSVETSVHTSTVELVDDLEPENDCLEPEVLRRHSSAVHIRVYRPEVSESTLS